MASTVTNRRKRNNRYRRDQDKIFELRGTIVLMWQAHLLAKALETVASNLSLRSEDQEENFQRLDLIKKTVNEHLTQISSMTARLEEAGARHSVIQSRYKKMVDALESIVVFVDINVESGKLHKNGLSFYLKGDLYSLIEDFATLIETCGTDEGIALEEKGVFDSGTHDILDRLGEKINPKIPNMRTPVIAPIPS